ncbi:MAG: tRNA adenosine(34) deaminase TadA [Candidatus Lightella neohaematopini]|nr:tRNA adenosine(34) deaminase TadA [Candidatus Lightella neohaematopini]MCV2524878.1 tRNA adenosine(34) deaminase TadA [Candidatus Lightella neohaematopini]
MNIIKYNSFLCNDIRWMYYCILLAENARKQGEVPVGAILVYNNNIIGMGYNNVIKFNDPTAHAEIIAIRQGSSKIGNYRLLNSILYVTLKPCLMCIGAIFNARIKKLVFGTEYTSVNVLNQLTNIIYNSYCIYNLVNPIDNVFSNICSIQLKYFFYCKRNKN